MTRDEFLARFNNRFGYYPQGPRTDAYFASLWAFDLLSSEIAEKDARLNRLESLIADDAFAISFQSMGQYRSALLAKETT